MAAAHALTPRKYDHRRLTPIRNFYPRWYITYLKQDYRLAKQYFRQSLEIEQKTSAQADVANTKAYLAELELVLGQNYEAHKLAKEAIGVFTKLGMKRELKETQALLARIMAETE